jgi:Tfp pilus assembly protein PilE
MEKPKVKNKPRGFSLVELSIIIIIIGIFAAGVFASDKMISKFRLKTAESLTRSSPIVSITQNNLWLETTLESSFNGSEADNEHAITAWNDQNQSGAVKASVVKVGLGPIYSNTINRVHAVKFDATSSTNPSAANHLEIENANFLNGTDYTIFVLEKRQSASDDNYFLGSDSGGAENQTLALGYSQNATVIHSQGGSNSYSSTVSTYADSKDKPRLFTFIHSATNGNKTYINGVLAGEDATKTNHLSNIERLAIGKGYTGEIGEIAIFTKALTNADRISVEDYLAKKWSRKNNRSNVANGSCLGGIVTDTGCSMDCSTASIAGVSSPTTVTDGQSGVVATCGATGYLGTITVSCPAGTGAITKSADCGCASGYFLSGGVCVGQCSVSVNGSSISSVLHGITQVACDAGGGYSSTPFTFASCSGSAITGSCSCNVGYTGSTCSTCDTDYSNDGGLCKQKCTINSQVGINNGTKVNSGSTSFNCNATNYVGNITYTCDNSSLSSVVNNCKIPCTGGVITSSNGKTIHTFTSGASIFNCPQAQTANVLVVGGGGGGGGVNDGNAGGGGGAGGLIYLANYAINASIDYTVTVGASVAASTTGNPSSISSTLGSITAAGGGRGVMYAPTTTNGASGGGAANNSAANQVGTGIAGQGNNGGRSYRGSGATDSFSGGGGGACQVGGDAVVGFGGNGGNGCPIDIDGDGNSVYYAGGGGGGNHGNYAGGITDNGLGGLGGGAGRNTGSYNATPNTGGGGSAGSNGTGASGIVIIAY